MESVVYDWNTTDGVFFVQFMERFPKVTVPSKVGLDMLQNSVMAGTKATLAGETEISLQGYPGREVRLEFPDGYTITRFFIANDRIYQITASLSLASKNRQMAPLRVLDSFRLLTQSEVEAGFKQKIAEASPKPLPQAPVAKRLKSDAEDENLKGKVRTIFSESEDLSGTWVVAARKPVLMKYFNESGNLIREERYDYRGNPWELTVYGYVKGQRVSDHKSISYEYNPPELIMESAAVGKKTKREPEYFYKYNYKYDDQGRLKEETMSFSDGKLWSRTVYSYQGNQRTALDYGENGQLSGRNVRTLDREGNEIEELIYDVSDNSIKEKYQYSYQYDSQGNWIQQRMSMWTTKDGKSAYQPFSIEYRTITYY
ncbi:MAG: hypothetical protein QOD75_3617 [Blastocatellia bacterium]|jgi:hypothetical protein|nr:hypothetical protein [Blastocatellia bacterium]